ncbi:GNAT family N-acetyltransferase [Streptococcus ferus]|uniref:GNAT family N-acetyltransferase n=1 Tax=Streptococcus ferus TaxID=1345 RepID=UPI0035A14CF6
MTISKMAPEDNENLANLIRTSLEAEGLAIPGTAYTDPQLDDLYHYYQGIDRAGYWVIKKDKTVVAGVGLAPITDTVCELQKLYTDKTYCKQGYGSQLLTFVLEEARKFGYKQVYLETTPRLASAVRLYEAYGFQTLPAPLPDASSHSSMDLWMLKDL